MQARVMEALIHFFVFCPVLFGLYQLRCLIILYAQGKLFTVNHVPAFRRIAWCFIAYAAAVFITDILLSLVLTAGNPAGERIVSVGIGSDIIIPCIAGCILLPLTHVMVAAQRMAEEQEFTV